MRSPVQSAVLLGALALLAVLACSGCADTARLCEARLTPINLDTAPIAPAPGRITRP